MGLDVMIRHFSREDEAARALRWLTALGIPAALEGDRAHTWRLSTDARHADDALKELARLDEIDRRGRRGRLFGWR